MGFFDKIKAGLTKTREALSNTLGGVFSGFSEIDDDFYDELEESLILADLGVDTALKATEQLRRAVREQHLKTTEEAKEALKEILVRMLQVGQPQLNLTTSPAVVLVIGVNGVGKTTTIGKVATQLVREGRKVLLVAGDTFRAAAADQLEIWAGRSGATSSASMKVQILPLWSSTVFRQPRPEIPKSFSSIPQAACITRPI